MIRLRKFLPSLALLVGAAILGAPSQARANFGITVFVDGVDQGVVLDAGSTANSFNVTSAVVSNFTISITSLTNWSGSEDGSFMSTTSNNKISTNFGPSGDTHTIAIVISEDGWLAPTGTPLDLSTSAGGSIANIGSSGTSLTVSASDQGFLDSSLGNSVATTLTPAGDYTPLQTALASRSGTGSKSLIYGPEDPAENGSVAGGTPFTLTQVYSFTFTTTGSNQASANVSGSITVAAPAPAGLVLALSGMPIFGIGTWLRRRRQSV